MSYTLHGAALSTCVQRVLVCAMEAKIDLKLKKYDFPQIYTAEWSQHQPFNQMPYVSNDQTGFELFESRAIAQYIGLEQKSALIPNPSDIDAFAKFQQAVSIEVSNFDPMASGLAFELVIGKKYGHETNPARVEELKAKLAKRLQGYERMLSKTKYLAGDKLSFADLYHLPYGSMVVALGVAPGLTDGSLPNVARWWKEITELESWKKVSAMAAEAREALAQAQK